jgi:hypothetical protein
MSRSVLVSFWEMSLKQALGKLLLEGETIEGLVDAAAAHRCDPALINRLRSLYLIDNEGKKASHGGHGGHGVAEYLLQCLWMLLL